MGNVFRHCAASVASAEMKENIGHRVDKSKTSWIRDILDIYIRDKSLIKDRDKYRDKSLEINP